MHQFRMHNTITVVAACFNEAEKETHTIVREHFPGTNNSPGVSEEEITTLFRYTLSKALQNASDASTIGNAFADDLRHYFINSGRSDFIPYSETLKGNIIAKLYPHARHIEKITGGDFGLLLTRPNIEAICEGQTGHSPEETMNGLLTQAKRMPYNKKAQGKLTDTQRKVLRDRLDYSSLLIYEFVDEQNNKLGNFFWPICQGATIDDVSKWLSQRDFPSRLTTEDMLIELESGKIGTSDEETIAKHITANNAPPIRISITWRNEPMYPPHASVTHEHTNEHYEYNFNP